MRWHAPPTPAVTAVSLALLPQEAEHPIGVCRVPPLTYPLLPTPLALPSPPALPAPPTLPAPPAPLPSSPLCLQSIVRQGGICMNVGGSRGEKDFAASESLLSCKAVLKPLSPHCKKNPSCHSRFPPTPLCQYSPQSTTIPPAPALALYHGCMHSAAAPARMDVPVSLCTPFLLSHPPLPHLPLIPHSRCCPRTRAVALDFAREPVSQHHRAFQAAHSLLLRCPPLLPPFHTHALPRCRIHLHPPSPMRPTLFPQSRHPSSPWHALSQLSSLPPFSRPPPSCFASCSPFSHPSPRLRQTQPTHARPHPNFPLPALRRDRPSLLPPSALPILLLCTVHKPTAADSRGGGGRGESASGMAAVEK
ncbi:unnamed protein product [Closterium sp. Naga37s-1]|nr:unnamed protein product [Closterium sp. Naga37s-1]